MRVNKSDEDILSRNSEVEVVEEEEEQHCSTHKELSAKVLERAFAKEGNHHFVHQINTELQKVALKSVKQVYDKELYCWKGKLDNKKLSLSKLSR